MNPVRLPDPAVVVLAGAAGSGKSHWAATHYRPVEIVASDMLRSIVGSGPADLEATTEAFTLLDQIVAARTKRSLTTVIDTLGLDPDRRDRYRQLAHSCGLPAVLVIINAPAALARQRNRDRDRPVPALVITEQLRRVKELLRTAEDEGWDQVVVIDNPADGDAGATIPARTDDHEPSWRRRSESTPEVILQVSRFPWPEQDPQGWLVELAQAADSLGFAGIALMDHLIQIPQVDRAWEPIPEPWVTLGLLAGLDTQLKLGPLVSPVTFRAPGILAKTVATLDALSNGRAFCGLGAGWWLREHQAYGLDFPPDKARLDDLQVCIETLRALWAPGTKAFRGRYVQLPETTCYPRPVGPVPIIVGGSGERRTLRIVAEQADACNLPSGMKTLTRKIDILHRHCADVGRDPAEVAITVLDLPIVGTDREDVAQRVERLRGRTPAAAFAARHHAGLGDDHARRYAQLADLGVRTVFVALPDLAGAEDLTRCAPLLTALR